MRNIEIKARITDIEKAEAVAVSIAGQAIARVRQVDSYFNVQEGRLKIREEQGSSPRNELIFYRRQDRADPKQSDYRIIAVDSPDSLKRVLAEALGVKAVVRKERTVYLLENSRIHLDSVDGLGTFIELEVPVPNEASGSKARKAVQELMKAFSIEKADLLACSYSDLIGTNG
ncbi:MAG: class IV adenylate cyclase [Actinobacteria bacterium]|jgi:predicted adenylyl cyclase CyaB|nr:class IV adenylate cyclase [Actinomycetota bacterium]